MRVLSIVHEHDAGPGVFGEVIRARGVLHDHWVPADGGSPPLDPRRYDAVLSFGGSMHGDQEHGHPWLAVEKALLAELLDDDVPLLGVCLGGQLLAEAAGAPTRPASRPEVGWFDVEVMAEAAGDPLLGALAPRFQALEWHSYEFPLPHGAIPLARSETCLQAYRIGELAWGIQFHAEVTLSDFESWLEEERDAEDAARLGFEPDDLRARTQASIAQWNELGRGLCERFLAAAAARARSMG